ncbi:MAG: nicotinate-nucleotide adenylyltransferase [Pseudomonadota bacterium]
MTKKIIGLFGGTFDPVHLGHMYIAEKLLEELPLDEVRFIPCHQSNLRDPSIASPQQRLDMLQLAIAGKHKFTVDDWEIKQENISYTIDTIKHLKEKMPTASLWLIIGADVFVKFKQWHRYRDILNYAHLIIVNRSGYLIRDYVSTHDILIQKQTLDPELLEQSDHGSIFCQDVEPVDISATEIRRDITNNAVAEKLPASVYDYIQSNKLYGIT